MGRKRKGDTMKKIEGFTCSKCGHLSIGRVVDTRQEWYGRRRRRICEKCGVRYTTLEILIKNPRKIKKIVKSMEGENYENIKA